jgi:hypothetical protein
MSRQVACFAYRHKARLLPLDLSPVGAFTTFRNDDKGVELECSNKDLMSA